MTDNANILVVTIGNGEGLYEEGLQAVQQLRDGEPVTEPATV